MPNAAREAGRAHLYRCSPYVWLHVHALPATESPQAPWHSGQRYDRATAGDTIHRYEQTPQIVATPPSICHSLGHLTKSIHFGSIWSLQARSFPRGRDVHKISSRQSRSPRLFGSADLRQELIAIAHLNFTIRRCPTCDTVLIAEARIIDGVSALKGRAFGIPRASVRVESRSRGRRSQPRRSIESRIKFDGVFRQRTCGLAQHRSKSLATIFRNSDFFAISRLPQRAGIPFTKSGGTIALRSKRINQYRELAQTKCSSIRRIGLRSSERPRAKRCSSVSIVRNT